MADLSLKVSRTIKAPLESVYNAWLDAKMLTQFMIPGEGMTVPSVETDIRVGGRFTIIMKGKEGDYPHGGEYLKLHPHSQIVFTWESPFSIDGSIVTLNFSESQNGTLIEIIHVKFSDEASKNNHENGWSCILKCLEGAMV